MVSYHLLIIISRHFPFFSTVLFTFLYCSLSKDRIFDAANRANYNVNYLTPWLESAYVNIALFGCGGSCSAPKLSSHVPEVMCDNCFASGSRSEGLEVPNRPRWCKICQECITIVDYRHDGQWHPLNALGAMLLLIWHIWRLCEGALGNEFPIALAPGNGVITASPLL